ncbi:hypothetical protein F5I97DRAFT_1993652 [Phlebopus sp. FC_14]|nr:hypothetical protein F5I97DRAFT_1993652 [Phlebopus sp. FC_14]
MPRELRPRKSRPTYDIEDENGAGPSTRPIEDQGNSDSEFAPANGPAGHANESDGSDSIDIDGPEEIITKVAKSPKATSAALRSSVASPTPFVPSKTRREQSRRLPSTMQGGSVTPVPTPPLPATRTAKMYALPTPSAHHRHRAVPVHLRKDKVERLASPPILFRQSDIIPTNSMTADQSLTDRISKAWGFNVGVGPIWEIMEDRSCFKEAIVTGPNREQEYLRRPRVYENITVRPGWEVLDYQDAFRYLPSDTVTTEDARLKPPPSLHCHMGPYGRQTRVALNMFDSLPTSKYFKDGKSYIFNAGAPVWGVDWCPTYPADRPFRQFKQYLAIAPFPTRSHAPSIGVKAQRPTPACVQIWALRPRERDPNAMEEDEPSQEGAETKCEMVLCLEGGPAQEIKWCLLPAHDPWEDNIQPRDGPRKLGILAGTFEDGSLSVYTVPDPMDIRPAEHDPSFPVFVKLREPDLRIELEGTSCWSIDWANSEVIAVGCTDGCIAVYDIGRALRNGDGPNIFPTRFVAVHQSAIRAVAWIRLPPTDSKGIPADSEDPTIIASGGYDGVECLTDVREPHGNVINRTRDVINSATYSAFATGPIMIDHDNTVKAYSVSPSMLGRGHVLMEPGGPVWSVNASDYHPQLAVGSADGSCVTTNLLKSTRRGGTVPFFVHKIYQLDYSRKSREFRMLEQFLPRETQDKSVNVKGKAQARKDEAEATGLNVSTGVWSPEIGVHRVAWNSGNGLGGAPLLASVTGSGLCRVDWLLGRWIKDKVPYVNVPKMRKEVDEVSEDESTEE